jgi:hypothetical protein
MNNRPDQDINLTNFLRQNRSIAPPELPESEYRLISQIDLISSEKTTKVSHSWQRYIVGGIGLIIMGLVGPIVFQSLNPPEPSIAELNQLNLFLEANLPNLVNQPDIDTEDHEILGDIDADLF